MTNAKLKGNNNLYNYYIKNCSRIGQPVFAPTDNLTEKKYKINKVLFRIQTTFKEH